MVKTAEHGRWLMVDGLAFEVRCMATFFGVMPTSFDKYKPFKVVGIASKLSEVDASGIVEADECENGAGYMDYENPMVDIYWSAVDSLKSLCQSYDMNPATTLLIQKL